MKIVRREQGRSCWSVVFCHRRHNRSEGDRFKLSCVSELDRPRRPVQLSVVLPEDFLFSSVSGMTKEKIFVLFLKHVFTCQGRSGGPETTTWSTFIRSFNFFSRWLAKRKKTPCSHSPSTQWTDSQSSTKTKHRHCSSLLYRLFP